MITHPIRRTLILLHVLAMLVLAASGVTAAQPVVGSEDLAASAPLADADFRSSPVMFIENAGQWHPATGPEQAPRFQVWDGTAGTVWLAEDAIWLTVVERGRGGAGERGSDASSAGARLPPDALAPLPGPAVSIKFSFVDANPHPRIEPFDRLDTVVSYFLGSDPDGWRPEVPVWGGVRYADLYPGVDLAVTSEDGRLVQRLDARPGANLSAVRLRVEGADGVVVDAGVLRLSTAVGDVTWPLMETAEPNADAAVQPPDEQEFVVTAPFASVHSSRQPNPSHPQMPADNPAGLLYGTFLGGSVWDGGYAIAVDGSGAAYVTGHTGSANFPSTPGAYDRSYGGYSDTFVVKLNPAGSALLYATFLGGSSDDHGEGIAVDGSGAAYVTGNTGSADFPTTPGAYDRSKGHIYDAFVARLNPAGSNLLYATFLGASGNDEGEGIALDESGAAYVTGSTHSANFPTTPGAYDQTYNGGEDAFVVKLNPAGSALLYATFLGGSDSDWSGGIAVDESGAAYVTGNTPSADFPTTPGAYDQTYNGYDAFVVRLNPTGSNLLYATFLGGGGFDWGVHIAMDGSGAAYVTGTTDSADFPTTAGAFDQTFNGSDDAFVVKLNPAGSTLLYATFLGGSDWDDGYAIAVDGSGAAYVTGYTTSANFPTTPGAYDRSHNGLYDAFVARLNPAGSNLLYATFLGASDNDAGEDIALDESGAAYVTGSTHSANFPTTPGAYDQTYNGGNSDAFIVKLALGRATYPPVAYLPLTLTTLPADPCLRYEPNDTLSTAWGPRANGRAIAAALCSGDPDDYFYVELPAATTLVLDLTDLPASRDFDLVLYNAEGSKLAESRNAGTLSEHIAKAVAAGRYYIRVHPHQGRGRQAYRLTATW